MAFYLLHILRRIQKYTNLPSLYKALASSMNSSFLVKNPYDKFLGLQNANKKSMSLFPIILSGFMEFFRRYY